MRGTVLTTRRLRLRNWQRGDAVAYSASCNVEAVMRHLGGVQSNSELMEDIEYFRESARDDGFTFWVVERLRDNQFLGFCGLVIIPDEDCPVYGDLEIGWRIRSDCWRRGYAEEAARAVIEWAQANTSADKLVARIAPDNRASRSLAEKLGGRKVSSLTHQSPGDDGLDVYVLALGTKKGQAARDFPSRAI